MNLTQLAVAAAADSKWLLNSSALLGRTLRPTMASARWWGLVRVLETAFGVTLANASGAATRALANENGYRNVLVAEDVSSSASMSVDLFRYHSIFLANYSRALLRETPRRRGRRAARPLDPIGRAKEHGLDIGLMRSSLERTPSERLAMLDTNRAFVYEMQTSRRKR